MTLGQAKEHIRNILYAAGDVSIPESEDSNAMFRSLVDEESLRIANRYNVLSLITKDKSFRVIRALGGGLYVRMPKASTTDIEELDIDNELSFAVANRVAARLAREDKNKRFFDREASRIIKDYSFKLYNTKVEDVC